MNDRNDEALVTWALAGDDMAFAELLRRYLSPIGNFLYQLVRDRDTAEDLTQETFLKAWKNLRRFDRSRSFRTWLYVIARNTAFDHFKKKKEIPFAVFGDDDEEGNTLLDIQDEEILPLAALERDDIVSELEEKLSSMPPEYRAILLLRFREDFSLAEIAVIQGEPYNTTKSRYLRAIRMLRGAFSSENAPEMKSGS
jgi:RNA polymerase sigma-70 factor (ECF subfamily)